MAPHLLPDISVGSIKDKSKASEPAKTIVTPQALWFAAQCISRMALGMTVSLLELSTFAHAICALIAYALWWRKPLDVDEPTLIIGRDANLICAGLFMRSWGLCKFKHSGFFPGDPDRFTWLKDGAKLKRNSQHPYRPTGALSFDIQLQETSLDTTRPYAEAAVPNPSPNNLGEQQQEDKKLPHTSGEETTPTRPLVRLYMGQSILSFGFSRSRLSEKRRKHGILSFHRPYIELTESDLRLLQLAQDSYEKYTSLKEQRPHSFLADRRRNWPMTGGRCIETDELSVLFSLFFAGLAYGGLHLIAWSPPVRTHAETLMWRISGIATIIYGAIPGPFMLALGLWWWVEYNTRNMPHLGYMTGSKSFGNPLRTA
ncbi:hypothetical protein OQA88_2363 [Cercophora sp. LCS_1]